MIEPKDISLETSFEIFSPLSNLSKIFNLQNNESGIFAGNDRNIHSERLTFAYSLHKPCDFTVEFYNVVDYITDIDANCKNTKTQFLLI